MTRNEILSKAPNLYRANLAGRGGNMFGDAYMTLAEGDRDFAVWLDTLATRLAEANVRTPEPLDEIESEYPGRLRRWYDAQSTPSEIVDMILEGA